MRLRLRLSLLGRMVISLGVLLSMTLVVAVMLAIVGGFLGVALLGWLYQAVEALAQLPRISTFAPVAPALVAALAAIVAVAIVRGWPSVRSRTDEEYLIPPSSPISAVVTVVLLGCLYLAVVEGSAMVLTSVSTIGGIVVVIGLGILLAFWITIGEVRSRIRQLREDILQDSVPAAAAHPSLVSRTRRLAHAADVPEPTVHVTDTVRPESVTIGTGADAVLLVSTGLLEALPDPELDAVLAHEIAHLANGDSRVMAAALAPVLAADEWIEDDPGRLGDYLWNGLFSMLKVIGQFGVAILSRGREWSADAAAAELTGSPAALAAALRRLDEARGPPETDLRDWERSVAVLDILPSDGPDISTGPFRTHPPTDERIAVLRDTTVAAETRG